MQQTISTSGSYRYLSNNTLSATDRGWYFNLENNGERVVVKPSMLLKTAALTTRTYQTSETNTGNENKNDPCASSSVTVKTSAYSWWMQFNALTGGALTKGSTYINFGNVSSEGNYANGLKMSGLSNFTFVDGSRNGLSVSRDGDSGESGTEPELKHLPQNNSCFASSNNSVTYVDASTGAGSYAVGGSSCNITVQRISWREIFATY
ncbi:hypothetical protein [Snodgrassella sp. CFCC 13594]|uniref:hypothetical protein n=1 Tax=Snodgrassella sp. CFCC 13594 TaxID=1775559 RepID=UPI0012E7615F|nr:hypothetical protein [Snodgrassella sp. CFCC 13594]